MFGRSETARERTLLRLIESLQRQNAELTNQLLHATGRPWTLPNLPENTVPAEDYVPPTWTANPEQEPVF